MMSFNISPSTEEPDKEDINLLRTPVLIPVVIIIPILILTTVTGNLLVIISYLRDKSLQTIYNIYIFNLAIADMLIGFNSMSLYTAYTITGFYWPLGRAMCKIFLCVDYTLCLETVFLMIILSLDRLILITTGVDYNQRETRKVAYIKVTVSWIFAFSLYGPAIIGWNYWVGKSVVADGECFVEFYKNFEYTLATATVEFVIPFVSIIVLNTLIYLKIRKRSILSDRRKSSTLTSATDVLTGVILTSGDWNNPDRPTVNGINPYCMRVNNTSSVDSSGNNPDSDSENNPHRTDGTIPGNIGGNNPHRTDVIIPGNIGGDNPHRTDGIISGNIGGDNPHRTDGTIPGNISENNPHRTDEIIPGNIGGDNPHRTDGIIPGNIGGNNPQRTDGIIPTSVDAGNSDCFDGTSLVSADTNNSNSVDGRSRFISLRRQNHERKAAKTLLLLVTVFVVSWTPYTVATIVITLCDACVVSYAYVFFVWLLWTKSCVNPFLYAYTSGTFRKNFKHLLLCHRKKS
ncbi:muscarinic acetylcholine receptor M2-like [Gigantopelta aegis]|uniref:muscarinic acetylcholine receptor M2-like n=1 Tax=Gigantopelta aegis TaxID=1735272 RepID=UPI001B88C808|nr:muscarinic acetylcholine receptor M2-like [Gigantopelta aegis]